MSTPNFLQVKYQGINFPSQTTSVAATAGDIGYNSTVNKWDVYNTASDFLVTELTAQTLTNKTINASTNTISNLTNANLSGSAGITNVNLATMGAFSVKANDTGGIATPTDVALGTVTESVSSVLTLTGWTNATIGSPTIRVSQSTTSTSGYLSSTDWNTFNNKQATITTNSLPLSDLSQIPTDTILGNNTGSTGNILALTTAQVNAILPVFTSTLNGLVPASGGGTVNFLRADGTWNPAPGTVTSVGLAAPAIFTVTNSPVTSSGTLTLSYSGTALPIANGGTNATTAAAAYNNLSPMTTTGDMEYEISTGVAGRLPIGSNGQVLQVQSGVPAWIGGYAGVPVAASYYLSTGGLYTPGAGNPINFDTKLYDTNSAVTAGTGWKFTAPYTGYYQVVAQANYQAGGTQNMVIYHNGSPYQIGTQAFSAANISGAAFGVVPMTAGDTLYVAFSGGGETTGGGPAYVTLITITQIH